MDQTRRVRVQEREIGDEARLEFAVSNSHARSGSVSVLLSLTPCGAKIRTTTFRPLLDSSS